MLNVLGGVMVEAEEIMCSCGYIHKFLWSGQTRLIVYNIAKLIGYDIARLVGYDMVGYDIARLVGYDIDWLIMT